MYIYYIFNWNLFVLYFWACPPPKAKSFPIKARVNNATAELFGYLIQAKVGLPTTDVSVVVSWRRAVFLYKKQGDKKMEGLDLHHFFVCLDSKLSWR